MKLRMPRPLNLFLLTFALVVAGIGLRFGVPACRQHVAIREIERLGGEVWTDRTGPGWLRERDGGDVMKVFDNALLVFFEKKAKTNAVVSRLWMLPHLHGLSFRYSSVTDAQLVELRPAGLRQLDLSGTRVSDDGLSVLSEMVQLESLGLDETRITDAGVAHLKSLVALKNLGLQRTTISDHAMEHLSLLRKLEVLSLDGTGVSDASIPALIRLSNLRVLSLHGSSISDAGVKELQCAIPGLKVTR